MHVMASALNAYQNTSGLLLNSPRHCRSTSSSGYVTITPFQGYQLLMPLLIDYPVESINGPAMSLFSCRLLADQWSLHTEYCCPHDCNEMKFHSKCIHNVVVVHHEQYKYLHACTYIYIVNPAPPLLSIEFIQLR